MYLTILICITVFYNFVLVTKPLMYITIALINTVSQVFVIYSIYVLLLQYFPFLEHDMSYIEEFKNKIFNYLK